MEQYQVICLTLMLIVGLSTAIPYRRTSSSCEEVLSNYNSTCDDAVDQFNNLTLTHVDNVTTLGNILETVCLPVCLIPQIDFEICVNESTNYQDVYCIKDEEDRLCYVEAQRYLFNNVEATLPCISNTTHCNGDCATVLQDTVDTLGCCVASLTSDNVYINRGAYTACEIDLGDNCPVTITVINGTSATVAATTATMATTSGVASTVLSMLLLASTSATSVTASSGGGSTVITLTLVIAIAAVLGGLN